MRRDDVPVPKTFTVQGGAGRPVLFSVVKSENEGSLVLSSVIY